MAQLFYSALKNDKEAIKQVKEKGSVVTYTCFGGYAPKFIEAYENKNDFYIGFYADPKISELIDSVNETFENIKAELLVCMEVEKQIDGYYEYFSTRKYNSYAMFKIVLNDAFSKGSKFVITLAIAEFLRALCYEYPHYSTMGDLKKINCETVREEFNRLNANSTFGHWTLGNITVTKELFESLDNIELMNELTEDENCRNMPYNSRYFVLIKDVLKSGRGKKYKKVID